MNKRVTAILCLLLAGAMLLFAACQSKPVQNGGDPGDSPSPTATLEAAKGRYVEEEIPMPDGMQGLLALRLTADGVLYALGGSLRGGEFDWGIYRSADSGSSWEKLTYGWAQEFLGAGTASAAFDEQGGLYLMVDETPYGIPSKEAPAQEPAEGESEPPAPEETPPEGEPVPEAGEEGEASDGDLESDTASRDFSNVQYRLLHGDANGYTELTPPTEFVWEMQGLDNDRLLFIGMQGARLVDGKTGEHIDTIDLQRYYSGGGGISVEGDTLACYAGNAIRLIDLETGALMNELPKDPNKAIEEDYSYGVSNVVLAIEQGGEAVYYADSTGIGRVLADGTVSEQVVDGSLVSLGMPSTQPERMLALPDGSFLVLAYQDMRVKLFRYTYDADAPRVPATELNVYALHDSRTVRQAIGQFQLQNPDVKVSLRVGVSDGVTESDALRTLSTELLAGKGPDILMLDGMPVESYINKGVLLDINELFRAGIESGEYLPHIAQTYAREGKLYAIPARFTAPMLMGTDIGGIGSLATLASWFQAQKVKNIGSKAELLDVFYDALSWRWFQADGQLDEQAFRQDMELLGGIAAQTVQQREGHYGGGDLTTGAMNWMRGAQPAAIGYVEEIWDFSVIYSAIREKGAGEMKLFPEAEGVFIPRTILGINAGGEKLDAAKAFVAFAMSQEVLQNSLQDGLSVNLPALRKSAEPPAEGVTGSIGMSFSIGETEDDEELTEEEYAEAYETIMLELIWPDEAYLNDFLQQVEGLTRAAAGNSLVKGMILEAMQGYMAGEETLDTAMQALNDKLFLYLAE